MLSDRAALYEAAIPIRSGGRAAPAVRLPARTSVIVFVREDDVDVTVEIRKGGAFAGRADSAIHRNSVQRVALTTVESAEYTLALTAKQNSGGGDSVDVRIVASSRATSNDACWSAQQKLAAADQAYAFSHDVTSTKAQSMAPDAASANTLAARAYHDAAGLLASEAPSVLRAQALHAEASLYNNDIRDWDQTTARANQAAGVYAAAQDLYGRARVLAVGAEARIETASAARQDPSGKIDAGAAFAAVRTQLGELAAFHSARGERYDEGRALNNIAVSYHLQAAYSDALPAYGRALAVFEKANEQSGEAMVLQNTALIEYELGRASESVSHYAKVLALIREEDDPGAFAAIEGNSALANWAAGHYDLALQQFNDALRIATALQDPYTQGTLLHNIGSLYYTLGDHPRALELFQQALALRTAQVNARVRTATLRAIGNILREQGNAADALRTHEEALALATAPQTRALIEVQAAKDLSALARPDEALQRLQLVLNDPSQADEVTRARARAERASYYAARGDAVRAEADLQTAQRAFRKYEAPEDEFEAWVALARVYRGRGALDKAMAALDQALALAEEVRAQTSNPELRASLAQPLRPAFDLKVALLAERYFKAGASSAERTNAALQALTTAEQARARALEDFETFDVSAPGVPAEVVVRRREIYRELAARRSRLATLLDRVGEQDTRVRAIRGDIVTLRQQLDEIDARIGAASGQARERATGTRAAWAFGSIPENLALIEYWLGDEGTYAWVATRAGIAMSRLRPSAELNRVAREYHESLRGFGVIPPAQRLRLGEQLHQLVLAPLGPSVAKYRTLVFAPDGALHYVPFSTLRENSGGRTTFLVERHDVAVTTSIGRFLSRASGRTRAAPTREMLLVADPVYEASDARLTSLASRATTVAQAPRVAPMLLVRGSGREGALPRLPATAQEAETIAGLLPKGSVDRLQGLTATRDRFLAAGLERYRFIHIASHAINDAEIPQASALVLSTVDSSARPADGRVLAADFVNVQLNAEAVVLSACDTALGKNVAGEGLIGLQYVVLSRGAESVVSSLWPVIDQASAEVMSHFYTARLRGGQTLEGALSNAMRALLTTGRFKDPGVWGAFTLTVAHAEVPDRGKPTTRNSPRTNNEE